MALLAALAVFISPAAALAFNSSTHEQITRNALSFLAADSETLAETRSWLDRGSTGDKAVLEEMLVRAAVDADFKSDLWLDGWWHDPFTGASSGGGFTFFTGMFHYLNVVDRGDYWEHDGYAYRHGSHSGNDEYLNTPSATVRGEVSVTLGGRNDAHPIHGYSLPVYKLGFKGSDRDWRELFYGTNDAEDAVFPPASVPAQLAFETLLKTPIAAETVTDSWNERLPLVTGLTSTGYLTRHYWRGELKGLPKGFDLLGLTLHMAQDMGMPQHAQGTADWCHQELEDLADKLLCDRPTTTPVDYRNGQFGGDARPYCNRLFDAELVRRLRKEHAVLDPRQNFTVTARLNRLAELSASWQWGDPDWSVDFVGTVLPDGRAFSADRCRDLVKEPAVAEQIRFQYNLAVAASSALIENAAYSYESRRIKLRRWLPLRLFDFFRL